MDELGHEYTSHQLKVDSSKSRLRALRENYPSNPLFREKIEAPEGWVPVYHTTSQEALGSIGHFGLRPAIALPNTEVEEALARFAPEGISRRGAVFAYPGLTGFDELSVPGEVVLELRIDPGNSRVASAQTYTELVSAMFRRRNPEAWARTYWDESVPLKEFIEGDKKGINVPEVIIPGAVRPEQIRILGVLTK